MRVWRIGSKWGKENESGENLLPVFKKEKFVFNGDHKDDINNKVNKGDLIVIASGNAIKGLGVVEKKLDLDDITDEYLENEKDYGEISGLKLEKIYWYEDYPNIRFEGSLNRGDSFHEIHNGRNLILSDFKKLLNMEINNRTKETVLATKNVILTGAPGTGKTFLAKEVALKIMFGKDREELLSSEENEQLKTQFAFVQFHPSYDYTDFVEGLRPDKKVGNEIGFKLKNGIFKEFCKHALVAFKADKDKDEEQRRKFVFVIDEINRGEISKIFGELFYSLDPGYRGSSGSVKTQYHNINAKEDFVDTETVSFYIPENVYVIGTMNDIDRSVESFDFALRRRFAWIEINPTDRTSMWDGQLEDIVKAMASIKMETINAIIRNNPNLGSPYQIGPAYFLKLRDYNGDFTRLWDYHLCILLKEYLRGLPGANDTLTSIQNAYNNANQNNG